MGRSPDAKTWLAPSAWRSWNSRSRSAAPTPCATGAGTGSRTPPTASPAPSAAKPSGSPTRSSSIKVGISLVTSKLEQDYWKTVWATKKIRSLCFRTWVITYVPAQMLRAINTDFTLLAEWNLACFGVNILAQSWNFAANRKFSVLNGYILSKSNWFHSFGGNSADLQNHFQTSEDPFCLKVL